MTTDIAALLSRCENRTLFIVMLRCFINTNLSIYCNWQLKSAGSNQRGQSNWFFPARYHQPPCWVCLCWVMPISWWKSMPPSLNP